MMIDPEGFYECEIRGKDREGILRVICRLKREMAKLKRTMEHPEYGNAPILQPSEATRLWCTRLYLERAKEALEEAGFRPTQATISRGIKELRVVKELTSLGSYRYTTGNNEIEGTFSTRLNTIFKECVISFDYAQNIIVVRTLPGLASAAASAIDGMNIQAVVGSLAGDDTVMIVMRDTNSAALFCGEMKSLLG